MKKINLSQDIFLDEVKTLIEKGTSVTITVKGNSMNPFLKHNRDKVILSPFKINELRVGDFILAQDVYNRHVLHRIINKDKDSFTLMGDGNLKEQEKVSTAHVIAKVSTVIRKDRSYSCDSKIWKSYSHIWVKALPLRRYLLKILRLTNLI